MDANQLSLGLVNEILIPKLREILSEDKQHYADELVDVIELIFADKSFFPLVQFIKKCFGDEIRTFFQKQINDYPSDKPESALEILKEQQTLIEEMFLQNL